ncbi:MAG: hypothetical protein NTY08_01795 [Proteobacteria bacterium]|nr:hypothetical protein [Pseudomonadota bacterium]
MNTIGRPFRRLFRAVLCVLSTVFLSSSLLAATAVVLPAKGIGVSDRVLQTYEELIKMSLKQAKYRVVSDNKAAADLTFSPTITAVGNGFILGLEKQSKSGETYEDNFKVASENELDLGTARLVKSVLKEEAATKAATVDDVTAAEVKSGTARQETVKRVQVAFGPTWTYGFNTTKMLYNFELAYVWERDQLAPRMFSEFNVGPGIKQAFSASAGLGLDYYLTNSKQAPFVGLDVGYGFFYQATTAEQRARVMSGFTVGANVGYSIMRTADTSMYVAANYRPVLGGFGGKGAGMYGIQIGLLY